MVWLQKFLGNKPDGQAIFKVVDTIDLIAENISNQKEQILPFCSLNQQSTPEIFAWGVFEYDQDFLTKISKAWRVDTQTGKFQEIPTDSVVCINPAGANYNG